jgi:hypothetical protein
MNLYEEDVNTFKCTCGCLDTTRELDTNNIICCKCGKVLNLKDAPKVNIEEFKNKQIEAEVAFQESLKKSEEENKIRVDDDSAKVQKLK